MRSALLDILLHDEAIKSILSKSEKLYWESQINSSFSFDESEFGLVSRVGYILSNAALTSSIDDKNYVEESYLLLANYPISNDNARVIYDNTAGYDFKDQDIIYYFYLASLALKLDKTISARLQLNNYNSDSSCCEVDWGQRILYTVIKSLLLLIRKHHGITDIRAALELIDSLRNEQKDFEEKYITNYPIKDQQQAALSLVGIYHVSKAVSETADYLIAGYSQQQRRISSSVRQHIDIARSLIDKQSRLSDFFLIIWNDLQLLIKNSIWSYIGFQDKIKQLCFYKAEHDDILELLPSQQKALSENLLNVAANAIVLQMPTSAGKTLMAEFNILVTRSLRFDAKIIYIVPSRALMNQVFFDLREDFRELKMTIERTSSAVEIDPTESDFLVSDNIDVLVTTPEKLDLLIRRNHPSVEDVSLFIVDEAHTIENGQRGARLELLLTMLRRERPDAKYMLLSPFLPNGGETMRDWLGGGNAIHIDWRPSEKIVFGLSLTKRKVKFEILRTPFSTKIKENKFLEAKKQDNFVANPNNKDGILEYIVKKFGEQKRTLLILCKGRNTANHQAEKIAKWVDAKPSVSDDVHLVQKYMDEEIGCPTIYTQLLSKGITVHHAGLSDETKILIEHLIRKGNIQYICATSTIAEGVNFPVASVYFDTYYKGGNMFTSNDFWNIAGRAGRTMVDDFGKIILPFNTSDNKKKAFDIISKEAEQLSSVLAQLFVEREEVISKLSQQNGIRDLTNEFPDSFSPLFQYFVHILNVADNDYVADVEDLFKDTLAYNLLSGHDKDIFIDICKRIYFSIKTKYSGATGALKFADKTGFSVPSVLNIMREKSDNPEIADLESWQPDVMFDANNPEGLAEKINAIAALKETQLGTDSTQSPFNPEIASKILIGWVKGNKIDQISTIHPYFSSQTDINVRVSDFITYMTSMRFKASWGLSALEGIIRGNGDDMKDSYVPSFVYYGVDNKKSLALRMLGMPRSLSSSMSQIIEGDMKSYTFARLRGIINDLPLTDWDALRPHNSHLSGEEWKHIVSILMK